MIWYERACELAGRYMPWAGRGEVREEFYDYLKFTGLRVRAEDALALAYGSTIVSGVLLSIATLAFALAGLPWVPVFFLALLGPLLFFSYFGNYPRNYARVYRVKVLGTMPEMVSNLAMALKINPNLERALGFAADRTKGSIGEELKDMVWGVYMRVHSSADQALLRFAEEWRDWNEDFSRSIHYLRGSMLEKREEERISMIDKAVEVILAGTSKKMDGFVSSLESPTIMLYFSGILLPLILIALLPTLSYVGTSIGPFEIFVAYCVVLPSLIYLWSRSILNKRPVTIVPPEIPEDHPGFPPRGRVSIGSKSFPAAPLILLASGGLSAVGLMASGSGKYLLDSSILVIWGISLGLSLYLYATTAHKARMRMGIKETEDEFIDALAHLGNRLGEGRPLEDALAHVGWVMKKSGIGEVFVKAANNVAIARKTLHSALFDPEEGALRFVYSDMIHNVMDVVVESSRKGSEAASAAVLRIARHLENLRQIEARIQEKLDSTVASMRATMVYFAPFIAGVVVVLQDLMNEQLLKTKEAATFSSFNPSTLEGPIGLDVSRAPDIAGALSGNANASSIPMGVLQLILGIYLIETVVIMTSYIEEIRSGADEVSKRIEIAKNLVLATAVFTISIITAHLFLSTVS